MDVKSATKAIRSEGDGSDICAVRNGEISDTAIYGDVKRTGYRGRASGFCDYSFMILSETPVEVVIEEAGNGSFPCTAKTNYC